MLLERRQMCLCFVTAPAICRFPVFRLPSRGAIEPCQPALRRAIMPKANLKARSSPLSVRVGPEGSLVLPRDSGTISFTKDFLSSEQSCQLFSKLVDAKSWQRTEIDFFGKSVLQPRDTAFFGTKLYSYSNERRKPTGWNEEPAAQEIHRLGQQIALYLNLAPDYFNVVLANKYFTGEDYMGWHSDNEKSLGEQPIIASVSVGATRRFLVRPKPATDLGEKHFKIEYNLTPGSLLVMSGKMQKFYHHSVPKIAISKCNDIRINLTYRRVIEEDDENIPGHVRPNTTPGIR